MDLKLLNRYSVSRQQLIFRFIVESLNEERLSVLLHIGLVHQFTAYVTVRPMFIFRRKYVINTLSTPQSCS